MRRILPEVLLVCGLAIAFQACCTKNKCASTIELTVIGADGAIMKEADGVTVEGSATVFACDPEASCSFRIGNAGEFTVRMQGYRSETLQVDIEKDDCDNTLSQSIKIRMVPDGNDSTPSIERSASDAC